MKGLVDLIFNIIPVLIVAVFLFFSPLNTDIKIKQVYLGNLERLFSQGAFLAILSSTNSDTLTGSNKATMEIIGEKILIKTQSIDFLKEDLEKMFPKKCYEISLGSEILLRKDVNCPSSPQSVEAKIVIPFNPSKLTEKIKLVVR